MTLLIFFAIVFATIVLAIVLQRIIHCPILVGFAFFAIALVVAVILANTTLVILAIILGIIAFLSAFFDCLLSNSNFFRNNKCLRCDGNNNCKCNCCNNNCNNNCNNMNCGCDETLTILNNNGEVVARINGNSVTCNDDNNNDDCGCGCNRLDTTSNNYRGNGRRCRIMY
ncbi:MAG: hypothetical protein HFJ55_01845 [Clostridia bacterium]|nr:hypothetical protein [Clostridia bacterium]